MHSPFDLFVVFCIDSTSLCRAGGSSAVLCTGRECCVLLTPAQHRLHRERRTGLGPRRIQLRSGSARVSHSTRFGPQGPAPLRLLARAPCRHQMCTCCERSVDVASDIGLRSVNLHFPPLSSAFIFIWPLFTNDLIFVNSQYDWFSYYSENRFSDGNFPVLVECKAQKQKIRFFNFIIYCLFQRSPWLFVLSYFLASMYSF